MCSWGIAPGAPEASIIRATARFNIWHGPIRSGKTSHSLMAWCGFIPDAPHGQLFMVGKTEDTLERNILRPLFEANPAFRYNKGQKKAWYGGREIELLGANDVKAESRIRGVTAAGFYLDELTLLPHEFIKQAQGRMSPPGAKAFATTNPDGPYHPVKVEFIDRADELGPRRIRHFTWPIEANVFLDPRYIEDIKAEYMPGSLWYKRFILGLWVAAEGAVYDFFDEELHVLDSVPARAPDFLDLSCDYGTSNATSVGLYASWRRPLESGLRCYRHAGYYHSGRDTGRQKTDTETADDIDGFVRERVGDIHRAEFKLEQCRSLIRYVILDPSAASLKAELRKRGYRVRDADHDVLDGIRTVSRMMKAGEFKIGPDASNRRLITQTTAYRWDPKAQARGEDKPLKEEDHAVDEKRYYLHTLYRRGIKSNLNTLRDAQGLA